MLETIFLALGFSVLIQLLFFIFATAYKTDQVTDLSYGLTFLLIIVYFFAKAPVHDRAQTVVTILVCIWSVRIMSYLFIRILKTKKDKRFDGIRDNFIKFAQFWAGQAIAVWVILLPALFLLGTSAPISTAFLIAGTMVWCAGFLIESAADQQKFMFKSKPENKDKWIASGLWKYSRHPNYFGEMLCWWGIFIITIPAISAASWLIIAGPLFITYLLMYVSGIPPLEKKYDKVYANNKEYQKYKAATNILIPLSPKKYA